MTTSDFKLRLILTIFKDRNPKSDETSNVQKGVMVLGGGSISEKWKLPGHLPPCPEIKGMDSRLIISLFLAAAHAEKQHTFASSPDSCSQGMRGGEVLSVSERFSETDTENTSLVRSKVE